MGQGISLIQAKINSRVHLQQVVQYLPKFNPTDKCHIGNLKIKIEKDKTKQN
jgi:hypothetical protein